jgi:hypothetical protein
VTRAVARQRILALYNARSASQSLEEGAARFYAAAEPASVVVPDALRPRVAEIRAAADVLAAEVAERSTVDWFALPLYWEYRLAG